MPGVLGADMIVQGGGDGKDSKKRTAEPCRSGKNPKGIPHSRETLRLVKR